MVTNVVGLLAAILGDKLYWWIDPSGAIALAIYTIANWSGTVMENAGISSPVLFILLYLNFPPTSYIETYLASCSA